MALLEDEPRAVWLTVEEKRAIISLKNDPNVTIVPADKGGATVIMDKADYKAKAFQQLSE